ncbi:MAG TPA: CGNR zinc finger domain-containing protein [Gemmatimonadaceae bacterium]|nr:CGNR zinc finger domain-containing protein [Gemmatimonadaceae bacterium]
MRPSPPPTSLAPELPFSLVAGDLSLDLVNTVDWTARGLVADRLASHERLVEWAEAAGAVTAAEAARLRRRARRDPAAGDAALAAARHCRWVLQQLFRAVAAGERPADVLAAFDELLAAMHRQLVLVWADPPPDGGDAEAASPLHWSWRDGDDPARVLWPVVRAAALLLASDEARRIRVCGAPDCGWMYVDRSRNGLRRWCQMETCGTRAKSRRRAERRRHAS